MRRTCDELGRFVVPKEFRKVMGIKAGDLLKMELISKPDNTLALIISKEEELKQCYSCGSYCKDNDNFCSNCGIDINNQHQIE